MTDRIFNVPPVSAEERLGADYLASRSSLFDRFVASTHERFWDPADSGYIDFSASFDLKQPLLPIEDFPELTRWRDQLPIDAQIAYVNHLTHRTLSGFYYGEQAAFLTCLKEADELSDPSAVEYAVNQAREESRHQHAFQRYIQVRFGQPLPLSAPYKEMILRLLQDGQPQRKFVGVQIVLEGLGLATLGYLARSATDPLLRRLAKLVMADEAQHHRTGRMLAQREFPGFSSEALQEVVEEASFCFRTLEKLYFHAGPLQALCEQYSLDAPLDPVLLPGARNPQLEAVFRRNARTLLHCGLVTGSSQELYAPWLQQVAEDSATDNVDQRIAEQMVGELSAYNAGRRQMHERSESPAVASSSSA